LSVRLEIERLWDVLELARAEIAGIYATRTMRAVRPARLLYARLRGRGL
jgi:hypothetical protein